jgi:outer membrane protein assembly factor BamB
MCSNLLADKNWNQFRGPRGDGVCAAKDLPIEFDEASNVRWKTPIHDRGWSSPVVWGNRIWLTTGREGGEKLFAICVDLESGKIVHDIKVFDVANPQKLWEGLNTHATPTPVIEEGRVYVHFGAYGTACLDTTTGKKLWERRDFNCNHYVRPASSPIIDGDTLFLTFDGVDVQYTVALDKRTGKTIWRKDREHGRDFMTVMAESGITKEDLKDKPDDNNRKSFGTPIVIEYEGRKQLVSPGAEVLYSYDLKTGNELWHVMSSGWSWNVACRPVVAHGLIYYTGGVGKQLHAVRPGGSGDVTDTHVAWSVRKSVPNMPSVLVVDDMLFMVSDDGGIVSCLDAKTGEQFWRSRLGGGKQHWASPVYAAGKIYFCSTDGYVTVIEAAKEFTRLVNNQLNASFRASPAVADDSLILRSTTHLYCIMKGYKRSEEEVAKDKKQTPPMAGGKSKQHNEQLDGTDWDEVYEKLIQSDAEVRKKVEDGDATKEQVIEWLKSLHSEKDENGKSDNKVEKRDDSKGKSSQTKQSHHFPETAFEYANLVEPELGVPPRVDLDKSVEIPLL